MARSGQLGPNAGDSPTPTLAPDSHRSGTIFSIQILRFVAAFAVTLYHGHGALLSWLGVASDEAYGGGWEVGASGVHIFFVISGFVMVLTSYKGGRAIGPHIFLQRRFLRIYPIYWVLALIYLLAHVALGTPYRLSATDTLQAFALYSSHASAIIGPGWTLAYEVYFYLCFAVSLGLGMSRGLGALTAFFVASVAAGMLVPGASQALPLVTNGLLLEFILGCWIGYVYLNRPALLSWVGWPGLLLGTALLIGSAWSPVDLPSVILWGVPSLLIVAGGLSIERQLRGPIARAAALLGDSSYFLYLSHILLLEVIALTLAPAASFSNTWIAIISVAMATACLLIAHVGHLTIEAPMLRLLNRCLKRKRTIEPSLRSV